MMLRQHSATFYDVCLISPCSGVVLVSWGRVADTLFLCIYVHVTGKNRVITKCDQLVKTQVEFWHHTIIDCNKLTGTLNTRHSWLTFIVHSFVTHINLYTIQPLQCQNQHKSIIIPKIPGLTQNSRSYQGVFRVDKFPGVFQIFQVSGNPV